jgi:GxxExxY protein
MKDAEFPNGEWGGWCRARSCSSISIFPSAKGGYEKGSIRIPCFPRFRGKHTFCLCNGRVMSSIAPGEERATPGNCDLIERDLTGEILAAAIAVHRELGPGLLESAYDACLCRELTLRRIGFRSQVDLPVYYKGLRLDCGYRIDLVVNERVLVELKSVERLAPIHEAQLLTYLRLSKLRVGLLINFNVPVLPKGVMRRVL